MSASVTLPDGKRLRRADGEAMPSVCCAKCSLWCYRADQTLFNAVGDCRKGKPRIETRRRSRWPLTKAAASCKAFVRRPVVRHG